MAGPAGSDDAPDDAPVDGQGRGPDDGPVDGTGRSLEIIRAWCRRYPWPSVVGGSLLLVVGGLLFRSATVERNLFPAILLAVVSAGVGAFGLLVVNEPVRALVERDRRLGLRVGPLVLAVGLVGVVVAVLAASSIGVIVAAVVVLVGLLFVNAWLVGDPSVAVGFLGPGVALLVVGVLIGWTGDGLDGRAVLGIVVWTLGLVLFKVGLPGWMDAERARRRRPALAGSIGASAAGAALLFVASITAGQLALLAGVALVVVGLSGLGIALLRYEPSVTAARVVLGLGLVGLAAGTLLVWRIMPLPELVVLGVSLVAAIGAWFVFRGEALVAVLLLGFVLAWVLVDRNATEDRDPFPEGDRTIVALGDSFISGEGAPRYFPGTNVSGVGGNACRRAPTAYPWLVADRLEASLVFLACSGARTVDLDNDDRPRALPDPLGPVPGGEDQIQRLLASYADRVDEVDVVLVSVGGNDVYFGNIVQACLLPQTCAVDDRTGPWLDNAREVEDTLVDTYTLLRETFGPDTAIVAVPYPQVVERIPACRIVIGDDEIDFVIGFTETLNGSIGRAAARAGINVYPGSVDAFAGRGLCDDDPATNSLHLSPTEGAFLDRLSPANWVHGSMHPRPDGHRLIADGMATDGADGPARGYLVDLLASVEGGGPANPVPAGGDDVGPIGEPAVVADRDWVQDRLYETVSRLVVPLGLLLVGGLVAAFGALRSGIVPVGFLRPSDS
jgi:lysophospholipase L1-like esterase